MSQCSYMRSLKVAALLLLPGLAPGLQGAPAPKNFLQRVYGVDDRARQPVLSSMAPGFSLTVAGRELDVQRAGESATARLSVPGIPLRLQMTYERQGDIDLYRIRHAADAELRGEQVRF